MSHSLSSSSCLSFHISCSVKCSAWYTLSHSFRFRSCLSSVWISQSFNTKMVGWLFLPQGCIPVGCILPAAVAVWWGEVSASAHTGILPPWYGPGDNPPGCGPGDPPPSVGLEKTPIRVLAWRPPRPDPSTSPLGVGLETPQARPLNFPLGCGPGDLQGMLGYHPPGDLQGMLGYHLQCMLGYHPPPPPPWIEFLTHASEIPCPKPRLFAGGNYVPL